MTPKTFPTGAIKAFDWETVPSSWRFDLLGSVADIRRGASPRPAGDPRYFGGTIPWFKIGDATKAGSRFLAHTAEFVNERGAKCSVRVPAGSLIISNSGVSLGFAIITKVEGCIHDGWLLLQNLRGVDRDYLFYCINLLTQGIRRMADGTTQPNLNTDIARRLLIPLPPLREQGAIARILSTLDDKIDLNRRINKTLEAIVRSIFQSWFVDFEPVRAKEKGRRPFGMDTETAAMFPTRLVDSALGKIPIGWEIASLGDHFDAVKGLSYKGNGLSNSGVPLHNLNSIYEGGGYKYEGIKYYRGEYRERHLVEPGDVIVANTEQGHDRLLIGYAAIVPSLFGKLGIASHHIYRLRLRRGSCLTNTFLYHLLNSPGMHDTVSGYANGTTVNMLPPDGVQRPLISLPPPSLIRRFDELASHAHAYSEEIVSETYTLRTLRDAVLPKLISGEIRIKDAQKMVRERV